MRRDHCSTTTTTLAVLPSSLNALAISTAVEVLSAKIAPCKDCTFGLAFKTTIRIKFSLSELGRYSEGKSLSGIGKKIFSTTTVIINLTRALNESFLDALR